VGMVPSTAVWSMWLRPGDEGKFQVSVFVVFAVQETLTNLVRLCGLFYVRLEDIMAFYSGLRRGYGEDVEVRFLHASYRKNPE
jgi:hypothetical protein